jgi:hypothetical protein
MGGQLPAGVPLPGDNGAQLSGPLGPASGSAPIPCFGQSPASVCVPEDAFDLDEHFDWLVREIDAGRVQAPPESLIEGPAISVSLGDACDVDPELLAAMCGPEGLDGQAVSAAFGQDEAADVLRPGPVLAALTAQAVSGTGSLTDNELIGVLQASRRLENQAAYQQTVVIAEFARRRQAEFEAARTAGKPVGCRDGEFPGEELAMELIGTGAYAGARIDAAIELTARPPRTLAGMADGTIDLARACTIASRTRSMTDADAAYADEVLAAAAPGLRPDQLARKAAALEMKLAPEAVRAHKELARHLDQRVEARREESGNASLSGRELDTADVIASKAYIDAIAVKLRNSGLIDGTLPSLRALALVDLTQGRDPLDRIKLADLLRRMYVIFEPIARDTCDHRHEEDRYVPSRKLKHLLHARTQACTAPACNAQAVYCDIDHTVPYPDGPTCECNTNPKCRRHHRTKQARGWKTTQPTPDTSVWITPSGRTHTTKPTAYDLLARAVRRDGPSSRS